MEEDLGVKAPVTRLRRRLSTEAEGTQSPLTPSTPTKKRSTRLAKPALELIDENKSTPTVKETPVKRGTRKALTKDVEGPEETPVTPSRRSTRIRSNTSLVLEAVQNAVTDSPRAKRAARRASHLDSDTESSTPAKPARRTRKDSTSSVEKLAVTNSNEKAVALVADAISEEPEKENKNDDDASKDSTPRKSPRLNKKGKTSLDETGSIQNKTDNNTTKNDEVSSSTNELTTKEVNKTSKDQKSQDAANLSQDSTKLINELDSNPTKSRHGNKTISLIEDSSNDKPNRKRTQSWNTTASADSPSGNKNLNEIDAVDGVINKTDAPLNISKTIYNDSTGNKENVNVVKPAQDAEEIVKILERTPVKDIKSSIITLEDSDSSSESVKLTIDMHHDDVEKIDADDQCVPVVKNASPKRLASESFVVEPMDIDETIPENVTINYFSDKSNTSEDQVKEAGEKLKTSESHEKSFDNNKSSNKSRTSLINEQPEPNSSKRKSSISTSEENKNKSNQSIVAEKSHKKSSTSQLHESVEDLNEKNKSKRTSSLSTFDKDNKRKSSISSQVEEKQNESANKSKRKSISEMETQNASSNENKSTLVLSQFKDISVNESKNAVKSVNDSNIDLSKTDKALSKEADKKNHLSTYLTSTPLQQKSLQKLAMQINTSVINPSTDIENTSKFNKSKTPVKSVSKAESESDSSSEDGESQNKNKMVDDEAEEASDDYESGDSRDDAEKKYEKENELPDRGETLESEQNFSDDSDDDYEKDSFIVSSNEEDEDLLSGSGDDLSLSDNELKMTSKSKKKFDERKRKEQKKASKEMYEARHNLKESKIKSKKSSNSKLESSESESEEEREPKKKNRQRIDSSREISKDLEDVDDSVCVKKKKTKRLSESVCEDNANEMEITINNQSVTEKKDPLVAAIKQEPKTPQKDLNISVAYIKDNIEQVQLDSNSSVFKPNETSDPLQATVAQDDEDSDSDASDLSLFSLENIEIKENYDSVLEDLNKNNDQEKKVKTQNISQNRNEKKKGKIIKENNDSSLENLNKNNDQDKKIKTQNLSLNWNEKKKEKIKNLIIDQLNLTQTKKSKKNKNQEQKSKEKRVEEPKKMNDLSVITDKKDDMENSDSIEFRLLFSEDSNDSEVDKSKFNVQDKLNTSEKVIPLKKSEAKTNIHDQLDEPDGTEVPFFIDTKGDFEEMDTSTQNSAKKKKKNRASVSEANDAEVNTSVTTDMPTNVSLNSAKKKKKNRSLLDSSDNTAMEESQTNNRSLNDSRSKKNKSLLDGSQVTLNTESEETPETNVSMNSSKKKKKNKSLLDVSQVNEDAAPVDTSVNVSLNSSKKKEKKNKSQLDISEAGGSAATEATAANTSLPSEKKKKKNKSLFDVSHVAEEEAPDMTMSTPVDTSVTSEKKKKKNKSLLDASPVLEEEVSTEIPTNEVSLSSEKKKKKKKNKSLLDIYQPNEDSAVEVTPTNTSLNSEKKKKKKKNSNSESIVESDNAEQPANISQSSPKKIDAESHFTWSNEDAGDDSDGAPEEVAYKSVKKSDNTVVEDDEPAAATSKNKFKKKKKKKVVQPQPEKVGDVKAKKRKLGEDIDAVGTNTDLFHMAKGKKKKFTESGDNDGMKNKMTKRKASDDDSGEKKSKVFKGNFFEKIHIPRLPDAIVSQLEDQPQASKLQKKMQALSTVPFVVEEGPRRKNKPSTYLEQSVYLNDSLSPKKKKKSMKKVPKVLPFTPTAITSAEGYTSNFKLNVLPENTDFIAETSITSNFKEQFLSKQRITKLKIERYKRQNNYMNKF